MSELTKECPACEFDVSVNGFDEWVLVSSFGWPDPDKHKFILGIDMECSEPYVFECEWDGDTWSNIGGESFTHWKPSVRPK